jgi:hypothetical protein
VHLGHVEGSCGDCAGFVMVFSGGRLGDWGYCAKQDEAPGSPALEQAAQAYDAGDRRLLVSTARALTPLESDDACDLFEPAFRTAAEGG